VKRLRHLREADSADVRERIEEEPQRLPGNRSRSSGQRCLRSDGEQCSLDCVTAREDGCDLGGRDAGASSVRQSEVRLRERRRGVPDFEAPALEVTDHHRQRILDADVVS
jgi:hypothetical protein